MQINFVYITAGNIEEARSIGKVLVESKLAACVNIIDNMKSIYMWEGALEEGSEVVMIAKTVASRVPALVEKVKSIHSYDVPCIVTLPVAGGHQPFLEWVAGDVG
jgi:periplasmic divalent cation tolerance protein